MPATDRSCDPSSAHQQSTPRPAPRNATAPQSHPHGAPTAHTLARRWGLFFASHGRAILAGRARPSIPADRSADTPESKLDLLLSCVGLAAFLLLATGWPLAWIAQVFR
jgi:hypothetical protein